MNLAEFKKAVLHARPPDGLDPALRALWWEAKGDWEKAHDCAQENDDAESAWVHAYLHRKEGDKSNAAYWYRQAGKPVSAVPLSREWATIARALLAKSG